VSHLVPHKCAREVESRLEVGHGSGEEEREGGEQEATGPEGDAADGRCRRLEHSPRHACVRLIAGSLTSPVHQGRIKWKVLEM
jgi:hypothetical protein